MVWFNNPPSSKVEASISMSFQSEVVRGSNVTCSAMGTLDRGRTDATIGSKVELNREDREGCR